MDTSSPKRWSAGTIIESTLVWGGVVLLVGFFVLTILPPTTGPGRPASRTECKNHLQQLALAMHNYHDQYGSFPPAYIADKDGRPMHSWRVLLLPFLEFDSLHKQYRFDEPWNGPHNRLLAEPAPSLFHCPSDTGAKTNTSYVVVVGPKTIFPGASSTSSR